MLRTQAKNLSDVPPATPGYATTEFWKSSILTVVSLLVATGVINPDASAKFNSWVQAAALVAAAVSVGLYSLSRGKTKAAAIEAAANVIAADKHFQLQRELANVPVRKPSVPDAGEA